jgi:hypothetical protein
MIEPSDNDAIDRPKDAPLYVAKGPSDQRSDPNVAPATTAGGARPKSSAQIEGHGVDRLSTEPKDSAAGSVQLLKKNIPGNSQAARTSKVVGEHPDLASASDGGRRWDQEDRGAIGEGPLNASRLRADADDGFLGQQGSLQLAADASDPAFDSSANRRVIPAYRVINQAAGPRPEQVMRSGLTSEDQMRSLGHAQQATASSNAQFVGQLAHSQHSVDVHQLPPDAQFLHQHISQEPCLQQPIFLVKLPQQQQLAQGGSHPPQVNQLPNVGLS